MTFKKLHKAQKAKQMFRRLGLQLVVQGRPSGWVLSFVKSETVL
jgi:hypothetical protein